MNLECGFFATNRKHCLREDGSCIVCNYRDPSSVKPVIKEKGKMSNEERLDEILEFLHERSCHSQDMWVKGMTKPFPCDCEIITTKAELTKLIDEETTKARIDELEKPCCKHGETTCARREKRLTGLRKREG